MIISFINRKKKIAYVLLFFQFFTSIFLSTSSVTKAFENSDIVNKISDIQSLMKEQESNSEDVSQSIEDKKKKLKKMTISLPELGNKKTLLEEKYDEKLALNVSHMWTILSNKNSIDASIGYAKSIAEGLVNQQINDWLNQSGKARVSISTNAKISGDFLLSVIDKPNSLLFTQLGLRNHPHRNIFNLGLGYRQYWGNWMYGFNTFYDYDYTGGNARLGLGGEAWSDYLKLAANGYFGLTDWHQSKVSVMNDYDERPATGFDVRAKAYLPKYPQFGGSIKYEKYFGKGVHLGSGANLKQLKDNPQSIVLGLNYTPIPLLTMEAEHATGDRNDTKFSLSVNYRFGVPLSRQLDTDAVDGIRSLVGNKYDFIDRNYDIVMQYHKQELISISVPKEITAQAKQTVTISATVNKSKYSLKKINWTVSPNFITNGGSYRVISPTQLEITLPAYVYKTQSDVAQEYQISGVGVDNNNNQSNRATTIIRVTPAKNVVRDLMVEPNEIVPANDKDYFTTTAIITNERGQPLPKQVVTFHVDGLKQANGQFGASLLDSNGKIANGKKITATTDNEGKAVILIRSKVAGEGKITATMDNGNYKNSTIKFSADSTSAKIAKLSITKDKALADGQEKNVLHALVTDKHGNVVENVPVNLTATNGAVIENGGTAKTNQHGELIIRVSSTQLGNSEITAEVNANREKRSVSFVAGHPSAEKSLLIVKTATIVANGKAIAKLELNLKDAQGNPISDDKVTFTSSLANSRINNPQRIGNGVYTAELTGITVGETTIGVKINGSALNVKPVTVVLKADRDTMSIKKDNLIILKDNQLADGRAKNQLKAVVTDANNNLVPNVSVKFEADNGARPTLQAVDTDVNGEAKVDITNTKAGVSTITATINNANQQQKVNFVADTATVVITESNLLITSDNALANGIATNDVTATVTDAKGNPVPNVEVAFTVNGNAIIKTTKGKTSKDGKATATVTSTKAGTYKVTAMVNDKGANKDTTFIADSTTAEITAANLVINPDNSPADGKRFNVVTAMVTDTNGNPVPNVEVAFTVNGNAIIKTTKGKTSKDGKATATVTSTKAGTYKVTAMVNNKSTDKQTTFIKAPGEITAANLVINPDNSPADGKRFNVVTAMVTDTNGNPVPDTQVTFTVSTGATITPQSEKTDSKGKMTATVTSTKAGTYKVTAMVNDKGANKDTTFIADSTTAEITAANLVINPDNSPADGKRFNVVTAMVTDTNGNPVPNVEVAFTVNGNAIIKTTKGKTSKDGKATATVTSTKAGTYKVTAMVNNKSTDKQTTFIKAPGEITAANLVINPDNSPADGKRFNVVTATVTDDNGNPVPDTQVTFTVSTGATITPQSKKTDSKGKMTATVTSTKAGTYKVTAMVNDKGANKDTTFIADRTTAKITAANLVINPDNSPADGKRFNVVTATVTDTNGNPVPDTQVTFTVSTGATITPQSEKTDSKGKMTATVTSTKAGTYKVTAKLNNQGKADTEMRFTGDIKTASVKSLTLQGDEIEKIADHKNAFTFKAVVEDANGNRLKNILIKLNTDKNILKNLVSSATTDSDGEVILTLKSPGEAVSGVTVKAELSDKKTSKEADKKVSFINEIISYKSTVRDSANAKGIEGATVKFYHNGVEKYKAITNQNGEYEFPQFEKGPKYRVQAEAKGYNKQELDFEAIPHGIILNPTISNGLNKSISVAWSSTKDKPADLDIILCKVSKVSSEDKVCISFLRKKADGMTLQVDQKPDNDKDSETLMETINIDSLDQGYKYILYLKNQKINTFKKESSDATFKDVSPIITIMGNATDKPVVIIPNFEEYKSGTIDKELRCLNILEMDPGTQEVKPINKFSPDKC